MNKQFQIKHTKDFIRREQTSVLKIIGGKDEEIKILREELKWLETCRDEINEANKIMRGR